MIEEILDYVMFTESTAVYPKEVEIPYLVLGLINEFDELFDAETPEDTIKEAGDVMWYLARLSAATHTSVRMANIFFYVNNLSGTEGNDIIGEGVLPKLAGKTKKYLRGDDDGFIKLREYLPTVYTYIAHWLKPADEDFVGWLVDVLDKNELKLKGRQVNNTLKGDGNAR